MANVNLPPLKIPQKFLQDRETADYIDRLNFFVFQLWKRTGGGADIIEGGNEQAIINAENIAINAENIAINAANIATNTENITINTGDIAELKQTFSWKTIPTGDEVTIGVNQQMIVADGINIEGSLVIDGELSLI